MLEHAKGTCTVTAVEKSTRIVMIIFIEVTFSYRYGFQRGSPTLPICKFTRHVLFFGLITFHIKTLINLAMKSRHCGNCSRTSQMFFSGKLKDVLFIETQG